MNKKTHCIFAILFIFSLAILGMIMLLTEHDAVNFTGYLLLGIGFTYGWYVWISTIKSIKIIRVKDNIERKNRESI